MVEPAWNTPARMDGLPGTNWKRRTGVSLEGTVADCVARWLSLADHDKRNCSMGWGPTAEGKHGTWGPVSIGVFVRTHGLPPKLASERGGQPSPDALERLTAMQRYDPSPHASHPAKGAHGGKPQS